ncbi:MAG: hypothetical protein B6229_08570 [Spirochaetaceae bacterium 4572_7]|nr:MAG: hypothetical protein B6229_08570 [Spirochaetaceae bacterium 4572_7]
MKVNVDDIKIKRRVRVELGNIKELMKSLEKFGLFHPISINSKFELISGFRRLEAAKRLNWLDIEAIMVTEASKKDLLERELDENLLRKNFSEDELLDAYVRLDKLKKGNMFTKIVGKIKSFFNKLFKK